MAKKTLVFRVTRPLPNPDDEGCVSLTGEDGERPNEVTRHAAQECAEANGARLVVIGVGQQRAAEQKETAYQAFLAGAEFVGVNLEGPERQFEVFWERQVDHSVDAGLV